ncbi:MAG: hypothetical protein EOM20_13265 [Spartobacteria bacterium]|nr:hypothetical protein [Spartobacteria bacterium]
MKFLLRSKTIGMAAHDGLVWRAYALRGSRAEWSVVGRAEEASRNARQLPRKILDFLIQTGARRLRVLLSGDVYMLTTALPEDATDEELHTALAYEAQGETGLDAAGHRLAAVRAHLFGMGGDRQSLLATGFEMEHLERLAADAENEGLIFEGAGSLELAVLAAHAQRAPLRRMLLVRERTSFYVIPENEPQPFAVAMLPIGIDVASDPAARERANRARERLSLQDAMPLSIYTPISAEQMRGRIKPYLGACEGIELTERMAIDELALPINAAGRMGGVDAICPWIGLPPPPRDPHRHGTVIMALVVATTLLWAGMRHYSMTSELSAARADKAAWESLESARKQAASESRALRDRQGALMAKKNLLEHPRHLPPGLLSLLDTLAGNMPVYSSLESIRQRDGGGYEITGLTRWQDGLPQLDAALREMGLREGMRREFGGLESLEGQYAQRFRYTITPGEDRP